MTSLHCPSALLPNGWFRNVRLEIDYDGSIVSVESGAAEFGAERAAGPVIRECRTFIHTVSSERWQAGPNARVPAATTSGPGAM